MEERVLREDLVGECELCGTTCDERRIGSRQAAAIERMVGIEGENHSAILLDRYLVSRYNADVSKIVQVGSCKSAASRWRGKAPLLVQIEDAVVLPVIHTARFTSLFHLIHTSWSRFERFP